MRKTLALLVAGISLAGSTLFSIADGSLVHDARADAQPITSLPFSETIDGTAATLEPDEPRAVDRSTGVVCPELGSSVWYRYTPARDVELHVWTLGSTGNTAFAVWSGSPGGTLERCNDDAAPGSSFASAPLLARGGVELFFQAGHLADASGTLQILIRELAEVPAPCDDPACPTYRVHPMGPLGARAGETNIGVNPRTNTAMLLLLGRAITARFDAQGDATFQDVTMPLLSTTNDPILWTDPDTGRTIVAQLRAQVGSLIGFTDDDGKTWQLSEPGVVLPSWDHQSVGGGPYPDTLRNRNPVYPNAIYYCAQTGLAASQCARSDNGGLTWGGPFPMNVASCSGLHGHVAVSPVNGSVIVPHKNCGGQQGVVRSTTAATTWSAHRVPGTKGSAYDPAAAYDAAGRLYLLSSSEGKPMVSVSPDDGVTWNAPTDLGERFGIQNTAFPMAVAGDDGRAAVAFYGTAMDGDDQSGIFDGSWYVYIATTTDAGSTWSVVNATPGDPVQRGCIWMGGGSNPCRNLLDFQGMAIDRDGRVLVSIADGCLTFGHCSGPAGAPLYSRASGGAVIRQTGGPLLFAG